MVTVEYQERGLDAQRQRLALVASIGLPWRCFIQVNIGLRDCNGGWIITNLANSQTKCQLSDDDSRLPRSEESIPDSVRRRAMVQYPQIPRWSRVCITVDFSTNQPEAASFQERKHQRPSTLKEAISRPVTVLIGGRAFVPV